MTALLDTHILIWWLNDSRQPVYGLLHLEGLAKFSCDDLHNVNPSCLTGALWALAARNFKLIHYRLLPCWQVRQFSRQNHRP